MNQTMQTPKGFRDFLPSQMRGRQFVAQKVQEVFERYGFEPLQTPTIEYASVLLGKYGTEADKLVFQFNDRADRELALRYDQTVPTARVLAQYQNELPKYFRRYQIQNVFRAEKPQKGRYREFTQCDIDIFGSTSEVADAEIIACTYAAFENVGYPTILLPINDRKILFDTLSPFSSEAVPVLSIIQSIDKLDKIGAANVTDELIQKGIEKSKAIEILNAIQQAQPTQNLNDIISFATALGVPKDSIRFSPTLARGLDYYTGMIFEVLIPDYPVGSFGGGGRYDNLIQSLGGTDTPAVGIAFGFDRMVEAAEELGLIQTDSNALSVLVTIFNQESLDSSLSLAKTLREKGVNAEMFPDVTKLDKQLKYADKKGIPYVAIQGPEEVAKRVVQLKNMKTRESCEVTIQQVISTLRNNPTNPTNAINTTNE